MKMLRYEMEKGFIMIRVYDFFERSETRIMNKVNKVEDIMCQWALLCDFIKSLSPMRLGRGWLH